MKLLSIIIPVYNVERYVERCIRSLETQDLDQDSYEIICINDGSPDRSREIIIRLSGEFGNIRLIDQENRGVSVARNAGITNASGKYLLFIDPDDFVLENRLGVLLKQALSSSAQMVVPGYIYLDHTGKITGKKIFENYNNQILRGIEAYPVLRGKFQKQKYPIEVMIADSSVGILFDAGFFRENALYYVPGVILNEDCELLARIHSCVESCLILTTEFYCVMEREGSATRSTYRSSDKVIRGYVLAAESLNIFKSGHSLSEEQRLFLNGPVVQFVILTLSAAVKTGSLKRLNEVIGLLKNSGLSKLQVVGCQRYHRICGMTYNLSPHLGAVVIMLYLKAIHIFKVKLKLSFNS